MSSRTILVGFIRNNSAPSVWVTSYCAKVFTEASFNEWENFLYIDHNVSFQSFSSENNDIYF